VWNISTVGSDSVTLNRGDVKVIFPGCSLERRRIYKEVIIKCLSNWLVLIEAVSLH
jgi:hypothetical protein